ncbi:MAG TPA: D-alanine--D-alanine ligase family protein [Bacteroidota bacterium]
MDRKLRVGVIFGGRSGEHEVSLVSASSIIHALDPAKYEVVPIGITREGRWLSSGRALGLLKEHAPLDQEPERHLVPDPTRRGLARTDGSTEGVQPLDVVIPIIHGTYGEDGTLQGLLELSNIPYVGAGVLGSALGMDKIVQKELFRQAKLPVAKYVWFLSSLCEERPARVAAAVARALKYPVFVKPANTGSSVGISKAHNRAELLDALALARTFDRKVIVEQGIPRAREIECAVLGNDTPEASVPGEVVPSNEFYDYDAKYVDGKSRVEIPARLPASVAARVRQLALRAFTALDLSGMARVDFFVTRRTDRVVLNEVNTLPGFTSISMFPKLWEATGLSYPALLDRLIRLAIERHHQKSGLRTEYTPKQEWYKQP